MDDERELLEKIRSLMNAKKYRIRIHAVRHMIEEGFGEENIIEAIVGKSKIVENYLDELRCLIYGVFCWTSKSAHQCMLFVITQT